jgi:hypothetical protein
MTMGLLGMERPALCRGFEQIKPQWIPCNCHQHFHILNRMSRHFPRLFSSSKGDLLMIDGMIEPPRIKSDKQIPTLMYDEGEPGQ